MTRAGRTLVFLASAILLAAAVGSGCDREEFQGVVMPAALHPDLASAPDTLVVDGYPLVLDANLNRDFMPICPPDGRPMTGSAGIRGPQGFPPDFAPVSSALYVVSGALMWLVEPESSPYPDYDPDHFRFSAHGGPKWDPGTEASVILEFSNGTDEVLRLAARNVLIGRTE